jgi:Uma2 family endonuclease
MNAIGTPHFGMVNRLNRLFSKLLADQAIISVQNPLRLDDHSEPQPDVTILKPRADDYDTVTPYPADVLLLIEVADSSLDYDRTIKAPLSAENGIIEYWIVNLVHRVVEVHRQPDSGAYAQVQRWGADAVLDMIALPGVTLPLAELLRTHSMP